MATSLAIMDERTAETGQQTSASPLLSALDAFIYPPQPDSWLHSDALIDELTNAPLPDVLSTSGTHLITRPNTPICLDTVQIDAHKLRLRLRNAIAMDAIRRKKYGDDIADNFRMCSTPKEAREQYDEARRKAQEELENYVPSDIEDEDGHGTDCLDISARRTPYALPTPEYSFGVDARCSVDCKDVSPTELPIHAPNVVQQHNPSLVCPVQPSKKRKSGFAMQQPLLIIENVPAATAVGLPSPPKRSNKRSISMAKENDEAENCTKRQRTLGPPPYLPS